MRKTVTFSVGLLAALVVGAAATKWVKLEGEKRKALDSLSGEHYRDGDSGKRLLKPTKGRRFRLRHRTCLCVRHRRSYGFQDKIVGLSPEKKNARRLLRGKPKRMQPSR